MIKIDPAKFKVSKRSYAVNLTTFSVVKMDSVYRYEISAVWFGRKFGLTTANTGQLWDYDRHAYGSRIRLLSRTRSTWSSCATC